jgi:hypothetical protein
MRARRRRIRAAARHAERSAFFRWKIFKKKMLSLKKRDAPQAGRLSRRSTDAT